MMSNMIKLLILTLAAAALGAPGGPKRPPERKLEPRRGRFMGGFSNVMSPSDTREMLLQTHMAHSRVRREEVPFLRNFPELRFETLLGSPDEEARYPSPPAMPREKRNVLGSFEDIDARYFENLEKAEKMMPRVLEDKRAGDKLMKYQ